jgi:hypothetical protein
MTTGFTKKIKLIIDANPVEKSSLNDAPHFQSLDKIANFKLFEFRHIKL